MAKFDTQYHTPIDSAVRAKHTDTQRNQSPPITDAALPEYPTNGYLRAGAAAYTMPRAVKLPSALFSSQFVVQGYQA
jgi:hypothetical protein